MKSWIIAARLRTLPLAFSGWLMGTTLAANEKMIDLKVAALTLLTAFLLQILSNFANDYGDAVSGVDSEKRIGPNRMVQSGVITKEAMGRAMLLCAFFSFISGVALLFLAFQNDAMNIIIFLIIGVSSIVAAIKYTVGKNPYGYAGFGDLFVFFFFGMVLVFGTYYLQVQSLDWLVLLPAASMGLFGVGVLNVNNIRDIESDRVAGKHSIPVRIGRKNAVLYHILLLQGGFLATVVFCLFRFDTYWIIILLLPVNYLFIKNIIAVRDQPLDQLDPYLKQMAISTLLFSVLFSLGIIIWFS